MNNNNNNIVLVIVIFVLIYCIYEINNLKNKEKFSTLTTEQQITTAVKKIYLADVEAIRLLSNFAIQLSQGGTTIPGNINFSGGVTFNGDSNEVYNVLTLNRDSIIRSAGTTHINNPNGYCYIINKNGTVISKAWGGCGNLGVDGDITANTNLTLKGVMRIKDNWLIDANTEGELKFKYNDATKFIIK